MRQVMQALAPHWDSVRCDGRHKPLYYVAKPVIVLGHYESPCGGCDTIGAAPSIYEKVKGISKGNPGYHFLLEGLLLSEDTKWTLEMAKLQETRVLFLTTPLEQCLTQIKSRREAVGSDKELNPKNTTNRVAVIERARIKLSQAGIHCQRAQASQVPRIVRRWLTK